MLLRHSALYVLARLLPGLLGMFTTVLLTRLLDPARYGVFGLAMVVMVFGANLGFDWLGVAFMRFYQARRDDPRTLPTFGALFFVLAGLSGAAAGLGWAAGAAPGDAAGALAAGMVLIWTYSWFELAARVPVAAFLPGRYLRMNLGRALFILAGAAGTAWLTGDPLLTGLGMAGGMLAGAVLGGCGELLPRRGRFDPALARGVLRFGLPMAASMALGGLANSGTRALVGALDSTAALGIYTAAAMLVQNTLVVIAAGIGSAGYSRAVRAVDSADPPLARQHLQASGELLLAVLAPAALGMALTAPDIAALLVGPAYVAGVRQLTPWMAAASFFAGIRAHYLDFAFQLGGRPGLQVRVSAVAAAWAIGLAVWLVPRLGAAGAAIALTVAMAFSCAHAGWSGRRAYLLPIPGGAVVRVALACAALAAAVLAVPGDGPLAFFARVAGGGLSYAAVALATDLPGRRKNGGKVFASFFKKKTVLF